MSSSGGGHHHHHHHHHHEKRDVVHLTLPDLDAAAAASHSRASRLAHRAQLHAAAQEDLLLASAISEQMKRIVASDEGLDDGKADNVLNSSIPASPAVTEELDDIKEYVKFDNCAELRACFATHVQLDMSHGGKYRRFLFKATIPEGYPETADPRFDITSLALSDGACDKLQSACTALAEKARAEKTPKAILHAIKFASEFARTNVLAPAFEELKNLPADLKRINSNCKLLQAAATTGDVRIMASTGKYRCEFLFSIPPGYPGEPVATTALHHNFPQEFVTSWVAQAKARAELKADPGRSSTAAASSARLPTGRAGAGTSEKVRKGAMQSDSSARMASKLMHELNERTQEEERRRSERLSTSEPQPHLHEIALYLVRDCVCQLAGASCRLCNESLLPETPLRSGKRPAGAVRAASAADGKPDRDDPAVAVDYGIDRLVCGHYYHDKCLAEWMMNPPFDKKCHVCSQPVRHHKYSESAEKLEARWAKRQERLREMDEVASLMGL
ncbi:hypothetical protein PPROV_000346100 [Pycnococcus provasolii]|uniref:RWD domain-containing protein n=1 Tax=Pycnococcus provasolii TaxID=41880 RepID=A0A830HD88_9CHLO|nr:hypothetical protein PPROV_000346100 [Pycnococcus provasolii]